MLAKAICLSTLVILSIARTIPQNGQDAMDVEGRGPYTIVNCGAENALKISNSLDNLAKYLTLAIQDAEKSFITPSPGYTSFFKDPASAPYVSSLLTNITAGPRMYSANYYSQGSPIFTCIQSPNQVNYTDTTTNTTQDAFTTCEKNTTLASFYMSGTAYIVLCPSFFATPFGLPGQSLGYPVAVPPPRPSGSAKNCLDLTLTGDRFAGNGTSMTEYMPWLLLEEIAHYYLAANYTGLGTASTPTYDINRCAALDARHSVLNPHNYVYYVANIYAQCTSFPHTPPPPLSGLEPSILPDPTTYPAGILNGAAHVAVDGHEKLEITSIRTFADEKQAA